MEDAEGALEQEENKVLRAHMELSQIRQEIDRKISEKKKSLIIQGNNNQFPVFIWDKLL